MSACCKKDGVIACSLHVNGTGDTWAGTAHRHSLTGCHQVSLLANSALLNSIDKLQDADETDAST